MAISDDTLNRARTAYARRDWPAAYRELKAAQERESLSADDLYALGDAAWWLGLMRETLAVCEECYQRFLAEGRVARAAMNALEIGFAWFLRGEPTVGSAWVSRARRLLADQPASVEHGFLLSMDANEALEAGELGTALVIARQIQDLGNQFSSPALVATGLVVEGTVAINRGGVDRGFALLDEAMLPVLGGQLSPDWAGSVYCQMISICCDVADMPRARHWTAVTQRWCDELSSAVMFLGICRIHRVQLMNAGGDWDGAAREATVACTELAEMNVPVVAEAHYQLGEVRRLRDDLSGAEAAYQCSGELGRDPEPGRSLLHLAEGDTQSALAGVRRALANAAGVPFRRAPLLAALVEIAAEAGDVDTAATAVEELESIADTYGTPGFAAWASFGRGLVLLRSGDPAAALPALRDASRCYHDCPYDLARVRTLLGEAYLALGERTAATELDEAARTFERLGATAQMRRVEGLLGKQVPPGGLTARELDVLVRVAEGLTNKQSAAALYISDKTVARHLANIYVKLGLTTRTAAAAWAIEHRLVRRRTQPSA
jgi:DNA-binding CsgD family transcriptional regulator